MGPHDNSTRRHLSRASIEEVQGWLRITPVLRKSRSKIAAGLRRLAYLDLDETSTGRQMTRGSSSTQTRMPVASQPRLQLHYPVDYTPTRNQLRVGLYRDRPLDQYSDDVSCQSQHTLTTPQCQSAWQLGRAEEQYTNTNDYLPPGSKTRQLLVPLSDTGTDFPSSSALYSSDPPEGCCRPTIDRAMTDHDHLMEYGDHRKDRHWMKRISSVSDEEKNAISAFISMSHLDQLPDRDSPMASVLARDNSSVDVDDEDSVICDSGDSVEMMAQSPGLSSLSAVDGVLDRLRSQLADISLAKSISKVRDEGRDRHGTQSRSAAKTRSASSSTTSAPHHREDSTSGRQKHVEQIHIGIAFTSAHTTPGRQGFPCAPQRADDSITPPQGPKAQRRQSHRTTRKLAPRTKRTRAEARADEALQHVQRLLGSTELLQTPSPNSALAHVRGGNVPTRPRRATQERSLASPSPPSQRTGPSAALSETDRLRLLRHHNAQLAWHLQNQHRLYDAPMIFPRQDAGNDLDALQHEHDVVASRDILEMALPSRPLSLMREWWARFPPRLRPPESSQEQASHEGAVRYPSS